jgi:hypothetical protein
MEYLMINVRPVLGSDDVDYSPLWPCAGGLDYHVKPTYSVE